MKLSSSSSTPAPGMSGRILPSLAAVAALGALVGSLLITPALAAPDDVASKQAEADRISAEIASINQDAEQAIERYNEANVELDNTKQKISDNEKTLGAATVKLKEAQDRLNKRLESIYRDGNLSFIDVVLNTKSFGDFISRFNLLGRISDQDRNDVEAVIQFKSEVESTQAELDQTMQKQEDLLQTLSSEKSQVESQLSARQAVLSSVQGDIAQMVAQQQQQWQAVTPGQQQTTGDTGTPEPQPSPGPGPVPAPEPQPEPVPSPPPSTSGRAVDIAMQYLGVPYVWGGASPSGFDCSGLVMYVYAQMGIYLPHSAAAQYYSGTPVGYSDLEPGDLVFFYQPISHVGIYIGGGRMIHAPFEGSVVSIGGIGGPGGAFAGACRL